MTGHPDPAAPTDPAAWRRDLAQRARDRLEAALEPILAGGRRGTNGEGEEPIVVDGFTLTVRCPLRLVHPADDYVERTVTVRRRLGLLALRHAWEDAPPGRGDGAAPRLARAVDRALAEREDWPSGLRQWFDGLGRAGRAAVRAAVLTWCVDVTRLVGQPDGKVARKIRWADPFRQPRIDLAGRTLRLRGSLDAVLPDRAEGERLLLLGDAVPGVADRVRAGHAAVLRSLGTRSAPERVSVGSPASGHVERHPVDGALLDLAVDRIVEVVQLLAAAEEPGPVPGPWCHHCHLRPDCPEGAAHVEAARAALPT